MPADIVNLQVSLGASYIEFYAEEAKRIYGDIVPANLPNRRLFLIKQVNTYTKQSELNTDTFLVILFANT